MTSKEQEPSPIVPEAIDTGDLRRMAAELRANIKARELAEEGKLIKELRDREALIAEAKGLQEKLDEAFRTELAFQEAEKAGQLMGPDRENFIWVSKTVKRLEGLLADINDRIALIEGERSDLDKNILEDRTEAHTFQEKVRDRIHEEARRENTSRTREALIAGGERALERSRQILLPEVDRLADYMISLARKLKIYEEDLETIKPETNRLAQEVYATLEREALYFKGSLRDRILAIRNLTIDEIIPQLELLLDSSKFWQRKRKKDLSGLISTTNEDIRKYRTAQARRGRIETKLNEEGDYAHIGLQYQELRERAREADREAGSVEGWYHDLPTEVRNNLKKRIFAAAEEASARSLAPRGEDIQRDALYRVENRQLRAVFEDVVG